MNIHSNLKTMNELICPEREYLEKIYIDFLRKQHPTLDRFREFASKSFDALNYRVYDATEGWTRDIRCCLLDKLNIPDIARLSRTCKAWHNVITSASYDLYWRNRYVRDYRDYPPTEAIPPTIKVGRSKKDILILWFDLYQYVWLRKQNGPQHRRTLRTFLEHKKHVKITKFPDIEMSTWHGNNINTTKFLVKFYPPDIIKFMNITSERITRKELTELIMADMYKNPEKYFIPECLPLVPAENLWHQYYNPMAVITDTNWGVVCPPHIKLPGQQYVAGNPLKTYAEKHMIITQTQQQYNYQRSVSNMVRPNPYDVARWEAIGIKINNDVSLTIEGESYCN